MADGVAFGAYTKWASGGPGDYCRGQIAGLESLFQNFQLTIEDMKAYVADIKKRMTKEEADGYPTPSGD
jgi:hypothetical protein